MRVCEVCVHGRVMVCMDVCECVHACVCVCICGHVCVCMCVCVDTCERKCRACVSVCTRACVHVRCAHTQLAECAVSLQILEQDRTKFPEGD